MVDSANPNSVSTREQGGNSPALRIRSPRLIRSRFFKVLSKTLLTFSVLVATLASVGTLAFLNWRAHYQPVGLSAGGYEPTLTLADGKKIPVDTKSIKGVASWLVPSGVSFLDLNLNLANENVWPVTIVNFGMPATTRKIFQAEAVHMGWGLDFATNPPRRNFLLTRNFGGSAYIRLRMKCVKSLEGQSFEFQSIPVSTSFLGQTHQLMVNTQWLVRLKFPEHC
jgi:hypothetical protein